MDTEATSGYSSVQLRKRDKLLLDKHHIEVAMFEQKLRKVKSISDGTAKQLFDAVNRGRKLAQSLGFEDVYDAQFTIDSIDHDISFRECYDRLHRQDEQLSARKNEVAALETKLHDAEEKVKELQTELEARTSYSRSISTESSLREQLRSLNEKYDTLKSVKERAAERYKVDFKKWRIFNNWLFAEDAKHNKYRNEPGITHEEKRRRDMASIMRKKQMMIEIGPDLARFEGEPGDGDEEPVLTIVERPPPLGGVEMDSDKENEGTPPSQQKKRRVSTIIQSPALASATREDIDGEDHHPWAAPLRSIEPNWEASRPTKIRRLSGDESLANVGVASAKKDKGKSREVQNEFATPVTTRTNGQNHVDYSAFKGRGRYGKGAESNQPGDTTINAQYTIDPNQNEGLNYQYDQVVRNKDERRRLDASDCECCHEYYERVGPLPRGLQPPLWRSPSDKPTRTCLRQSRSHSPEGRNPLKSQTRKEKRAHTGPTPDLRRQQDIKSHKKAISRHRHAWARAATPPGYWDIGFPDTQAVVDINEKAKQMHKKKKAEIDKDAENGVGKYRRR